MWGDDGRNRCLNGRRAVSAGTWKAGPCLLAFPILCRLLSWSSTGDDVPKKKPDPTIYKLAAEVRDPAPSSDMDYCCVLRDKYTVVIHVIERALLVSLNCVCCCWLPCLTCFQTRDGACWYALGWRWQAPGHGKALCLRALSSQRSPMLHCWHA